MLMQNSIINTLLVVVAWHYEKIIDMKKINTHHEILIFAGTNLACRQLSGLEENSNRKKYSQVEELEKACWNGIIFEMFPQVFGCIYPGKENFLWNVLTGKNYLYINVGPHPVTAEYDTSIDPYFYMMTPYEN